MKSSTGEHYIALDHVRALAAFLVFIWHFAHTDGTLVPLSYVPTFPPLAFLEEGHVGVGLFMSLSGYLFAKLLDRKILDFKAFLQSRALRLMPLLLVVLLVVGVKEILKGMSPVDYLLLIFKGIVLPVWPSGAWSIAVEIHFYVLLPLLLWILRRNKFGLLAVLSLSITLRWILYMQSGVVKPAAYGTIIGRIDQFVLGILAFQFRHWFSNKHLQAAATFAIFSVATWQFDRIGGNEAAPQAAWIVWPLVEGAGWAALIAWYDGFRLPNTGISRHIGLVGTYSYSIYLLHFFFVYHAARFINRYVDLTNFYIAVPAAAICFVCVVPIGYLSFRFIESPFLRRRIKYIRSAEESTTSKLTATAHGAA